MVNMKLTKLSCQDNLIKIIYTRDIPVDEENTIDDLQPMMFRSMGEKNVHYFIQGKNIKPQRASKFLEQYASNTKNVVRMMRADVV